MSLISKINLFLKLMEELFMAKYKITFTHKETGAVVVHYFTELKMGVMIDFVASQNQEGRV